MKKILFITLTIITLALTSCDNTKERCWRVRVSQGKAYAIGYIYCTQEEMEVKKEEVMKRGYVLSYRQASMYNNRQDCEANNANLYTDFFQMIK